VKIRSLAGLLVLVSALGTASGAAAATNRIHGTIVAVDARKHEAQIHHDPFAAMPMAMTMVVSVPKASDLAKLRKGAVIDADVDTSKDPWVLSNVTVVGKTKK
jgi:Cu/Ag efflux protein CusF